MIATGTWVILKDPREKEEDNGIILLDETKNRIAQKTSEELTTNILEVVSAGRHCKDLKLFKTGAKVILDPRMPCAVINTEMHEDKEDDYVLVVQENQVMVVL